MKRVTKQQMIARAKLVRKVRRLIGKGRTYVERGNSDMFFDRGFKSHQRALLKLTVAFGTPKTEKTSDGTLTFHVFYDPTTGRDIALKVFEAGRNNWVSISYM